MSIGGAPPAYYNVPTEYPSQGCYTALYCTNMSADCGQYSAAPETCGFFDLVDDIDSSAVCCACGGGMRSPFESSCPAAASP